MREIKFRLVREGKVVGYEIHKAGGAKFVSIMHSPDGDEWKNIAYFDRIEHEHKDQFTGLKDKNGKEIYEGDIVEYQGDWISEVIFSQGCFCVWARYLADYSEDDVTDMVVIGNVYENPELLK